MGKKKTHKILLVTVPNGYSLEVDGTGYMYFTLPELVEGFFTHIGLGIANYCEEQVMRDLLTACATYPNEGDAIQAVAKLEAECEALRQSHYRDNAAIRDLKDRLAKTAQELADTKAKLARFISTLKPPKKKQKVKKSEIIHLDEAGMLPKKQRNKKGPKEIIKVKPSKTIDPELESRLREKGVLK